MTTNLTRMNDEFSKICKVYRLASTDPLKNLALEDFILRHDWEARFILILWQNHQCVVMGRFQNPWLECNLDLLQADEVPLVRRQSGGGAVYHDQGNLNFTFIGPKENFNKRENLETVMTALRKIGVETSLSPREDILVEGKKISGSAFKMVKDRALHHGTLLINTDLNLLRKYLKRQVAEESRGEIVSKSVSSVPSSVTNINQQEEGRPPLTSHSVDDVCKALAWAFEQKHATGGGLSSSAASCLLDGLEWEQTAGEELVQKIQQESTWDWIFGETPHFTHEMGREFSWGRYRFFLEVRKGRILEARGGVGEEELPFSFESCINKKYGDFELLEALERDEAFQQSLAVDSKYLIDPTNKMAAGSITSFKEEILAMIARNLKLI
jgi:lipoate-protein ligase A